MGSRIIIHHKWKLVKRRCNDSGVYKPSKLEEDTGHKYLPHEVVAKEKYVATLKPVDFEDTESYEALEGA